MDIRGLGDGRLNDSLEVDKILAFFRWEVTTRSNDDTFDVSASDQRIASFPDKEQCRAFLAGMALVHQSMPYEVAKVSFEFAGSGLPDDLLTEWWTLQ